ncbi:MAG: hypothetical protein Q8S84_08415 [bacterium]|nr:hypothetical protein [bacterium]MDP3381458.1 hypothetical protein [bacterium]
MYDNNSFSNSATLFPYLINGSLYVRNHIVCKNIVKFTVVKNSDIIVFLSIIYFLNNSSLSIYFQAFLHSNNIISSFNSLDNLFNKLFLSNHHLINHLIISDL